uniref:Uncharacterized protein n=1 Tax=Arundo donax TaxID=35708 RepID=A0A0A9DUW0_ARUDO
MSDGLVPAATSLSNNSCTCSTALRTSSSSLTDFAVIGISVMPNQAVITASP